MNLGDGLACNLVRWFLRLRTILIWFVDHFRGNGDAGNCRYAGNNFLPNTFAAFLIEEDFHGYTLDDLNEIAGCVVRRKQGKIRATPRLMPVNPSRGRGVR